MTDDTVDGGLLLDVVIREPGTRAEPRSVDDETLVSDGNAFHLLDLGHDLIDGVGGLDLEGDGSQVTGGVSDSEEPNKICMLNR
jgi:hypothetical protein